MYCPCQSSWRWPGTWVYAHSQTFQVVLRSEGLQVFCSLSPPPLLLSSLLLFLGSGCSFSLPRLPPLPGCLSVRLYLLLWSAFSCRTRRVRSPRSSWGLSFWNQRRWETFVLCASILCRNWGGFFNRVPPIYRNVWLRFNVAFAGFRYVPCVSCAQHWHFRGCQCPLNSPKLTSTWKQSFKLRRRSPQKDKRG